MLAPSCSSPGPCAINFSTASRICSDFADGVPYLETGATFGMFVAAISTLGVEMLELLGRVFAREPLWCDSRPTRTYYSSSTSYCERIFLPLAFRITVGKAAV